MAENSFAKIKAAEVVSKTLDALANSSSVDLTRASADNMQSAIVKEVSSVIVNQTNQEPWYQSRVTIGAIVAVVAGIAGLTGYSFDAEDQRVWIESIGQGVSLVTAASSVVAGIYTWYGRWRAKKPLGTDK